MNTYAHILVKFTLVVAVCVGGMAHGGSECVCVCGGACIGVSGWLHVCKYHRAVLQSVLAASAAAAY